LTALCRALTWLQIARGVKPQDQQDAEERVSYWLQTFLNNTPFE
jgi:hypothetical protein